MDMEYPNNTLNLLCIVYVFFNLMTDQYHYKLFITEELH